MRIAATQLFLFSLLMLGFSVWVGVQLMRHPLVTQAGGSNWAEPVLYGFVIVQGLIGLAGIIGSIKKI